MIDGGSHHFGGPPYAVDVMTIEDVAELALSLPESAEVERYRRRSWAVCGRVFAWERPFSKADIKRFGNAVPPSEPIIAIATADLSEKEAILAAHPDSFFTIPHFDGYAAVLVQLVKVTSTELHEALVDGWLACAPAQVARRYLDTTTG